MVLDSNPVEPRPKSKSNVKKLKFDPPNWRRVGVELLIRRAFTAGKWRKEEGKCEREKKAKEKIYLLQHLRDYRCSGAWCCMDLLGKDLILVRRL